MPTVPAPIAASVERFMGRPAEVVEVESLSPGLRRVAFSCPALRGRPDTPLQEIELRVGVRELRHYTPARIDTGTGRLDVLFCGHADGPGTLWARKLTVGDTAAVLGPGHGPKLRPAARRVLLGDATALGAFVSLLGASGADVVSGAVEVPAADRAAAAALVPNLAVLDTDGEPGGSLLGWAAEKLSPADGDHYLILGHARTVQALRTRLRAAGVARAAITVKAFWATGKRGL